MAQSTTPSTQSTLGRLTEPLRAGPGRMWARRPWRPTLLRGNKYLLLRARYLLLVEQQQPTVIPQVMATVIARGGEPSETDMSSYVRKVNDTVTWSDADILDEAIIAILPENDLVEQLRIRRLLYQRSVNEIEYAQYRETMADLGRAGTPNGPAFDRLRSELLAIAQRIRYVLEQEPPKERLRAMLTFGNTLLMVVTAISILSVYTFWPPGADRPTESLFLVLYAGLVGGFISVQQRLQEPTEVDPLLKWLDLHSSGFSLLLSPIIGAVFAVVLFALLVAGVIQGSAFPQFACDRGLYAELCDVQNLKGFGYSASSRTS